MPEGNRIRPRSPISFRHSFSFMTGTCALSQRNLIPSDLPHCNIGIRYFFLRNIFGNDQLRPHKGGLHRLSIQADSGIRRKIFSVHQNIGIVIHDIVDGDGIDSHL